MSGLLHTRARAREASTTWELRRRAFSVESRKMKLNARRVARQTSADRGTRDQGFLCDATAERQRCAARHVHRESRHPAHQRRHPRTRSSPPPHGTFPTLGSRDAKPQCSGSGLASVLHNTEHSEVMWRTCRRGDGCRFHGAASARNLSPQLRGARAGRRDGASAQPDRKSVV